MRQNARGIHTASSRSASKTSARWSERVARWRTRVAAWTPLGKAVRLAFRCIPETLPLPILSGVLKGRRWIVNSLTLDCWIGIYELDKQRAFTAAIAPGSVVYDIGAHVGYYTLLASVLTGPRGRVVAFEPLPRNLRLLRQHLQMNGIVNVAVVEAAVGERSGLTAFDPHPGHTMGRVSARGSLQVRMVALDDLLSAGQYPPPGCIKMDIEGGEAAALAGARQTLLRHRPVIFLATHNQPVHDRCCAMLAEMGYAVSPIDGLPLNRSRELLCTPPRGTTPATPSGP